MLRNIPLFVNHQKIVKEQIFWFMIQQHVSQDHDYIIYIFLFVLCMFKFSQTLAYKFGLNKRIIVGNWKCNFTKQQSLQFVTSTINTLQYNPANIDVVIAPVAVYIDSILRLNIQTKIPYKIAAQDSSNYGYGDYTGQICAAQLKDIGAEWVILGHSDRRIKYKETNQMIVAKTQLAIESGLKVIYCFGQTTTPKDILERQRVVNSQLTPLFNAFPRGSHNWQSNIVLAYQPVWELQLTQIITAVDPMFKWLRDLLKSKVDNSQNVRMIYGGNDVQDNDYFNMPQLDGVIVYYDSLTPQFSNLVKLGDIPRQTNS